MKISQRPPGRLSPKTFAKMRKIAVAGPMQIIEFIASLLDPDAYYQFGDIVVRGMDAPDVLKEHRLVASIAEYHGNWKKHVREIMGATSGWDTRIFVPLSDADADELCQFVMNGPYWKHDGFRSTNPYASAIHAVLEELNNRLEKEKMLDEKIWPDFNPEIPTISTLAHLAAEYEADVFLPVIEAELEFLRRFWDEILQATPDGCLLPLDERRIRAFPGPSPA